MIDATSLHPVALVGLAFSIVSVLLGLGVAYLAVRGYLRSGQRPMLFIAVGFVLVLLTPFLSLLGFVFSSVGEIFVTSAAISQTLGLVSILYGFWSPRASDVTDTV